MLEDALQFVIFFLAVYGALSLISGLVSEIRRKSDVNSLKTRLVVMVKDQEDCVEGIIRTIFMENFLSKVMSSGKLIILDRGSTDKTLKIIGKLKDEYKCIDVFTEEEREKIFM